MPWYARCVCGACGPVICQLVGYFIAKYSNVCFTFLNRDFVGGLAMADMSNLSWCLCWDDGCLTWLFIRRVILELCMSTKVSWVWFIMAVRAIRIAFISTLSMLCSLESLL